MKKYLELFGIVFALCFVFLFKTLNPIQDSSQQDAQSVSDEQHAPAVVSDVSDHQDVDQIINHLENSDACNPQVKSFVRFLKLVYHKSLESFLETVRLGGRIGDASLHLVTAAFLKIWEGIKQVLLFIAETGGKLASFAGSGLTMLKTLIDILKSICDLFWTNASGIFKILGDVFTNSVKTLAVGSGVGLASLLVCGFLAWWFGFGGVITNIKEMVSLIGHPLIKRLVICVQRLMTLTNNSLEWLCNVVNSTEHNKFINFLIKYTLGWYKSLLCECTEEIMAQKVVAPVCHWYSYLSPIPSPCTLL